ncbi:MAG TPA: peptidylprolyl isomerase [Candidatus Tumulicola sp.]|nr:peptidylprolyl isomerase [Candidatus Tumulicola sp.]
MKFRFATLASLALALSAALFVTACGDSKAIAVVNGEKITKGELDDKLEGQVGKNTLAQLVQQKLIFQYATQHNIVVADKDVETKLDEIRSHFPAGQFETMLKQQGMSLDDAHKVIREQLLVKAAVDQQINVTDAQINDYIKANKLTLGQTAQVHAAHILVTTKAQADAIEAQLKKGADFAALAAQYSQDKGSKTKGGDLGTFGPGQMVPAFQAAAFKLKPGQISDPVQTPFGWHVIKVIETKPLTKQNVIDQVKQQQESLQMTPFLQTLRTSAKIEIDDPRFSDLFPSPAPVVPAAPPVTAAPATTKPK